METVIVIGGGASGLIAALTAAEDKSRRVIVLERQQRIGRKLLATGNGRCNLTNTGASPENYHGENPAFAVPALEKFPPEKALEYFHSLGLVTVEEYGGRVYPLSTSANSVLAVLRFALEQSGGLDSQRISSFVPRQHSGYRFADALYRDQLQSVIFSQLIAHVRRDDTALETKPVYF